MVKVLLFFLITYMISLTLNAVLIAVLYNNWINKQIQLEENKQNSHPKFDQKM